MLSVFKPLLALMLGLLLVTLNYILNQFRANVVMASNDGVELPHAA